MIILAGPTSAPFLEEVRGGADLGGSRGHRRMALAFWSSVSILVGRKDRVRDAAKLADFVAVPLGPRSDPRGACPGG